MIRSDFFSEFYFDILRYIVPGLPIIWLIINLFEGPTYIKTGYVMKDFFKFQVGISWLNWLIFFFLAYICGMVLSAILDKLAQFSKQFKYSNVMKSIFSRGDGYTTWNKLSMLDLIDNRLKKEIQEYYFDGEVTVESIFKDANIDKIVCYIREYMRESSQSPQFYERFYDRFFMMRNLSFSFLIYSVFLVILVNETSTAQYFLIGSIAFNLASYFYIFIQKKWVYEKILSHFYVLRLKEKAQDE